MTNEEIIEKLGYIKINITRDHADCFKKRDAIDEAVDIISGLQGCKEDLDKYKKQLLKDNPQGSEHYFLVTNMIYEFEKILQDNLGKFEDW